MNFLINKNVGFLVLALFVLSTAKAQYGDGTWQILATVQVEKELDPNTGLETYKPTYGPMISAMESQEVKVKGYIIPLEGKRQQSQFMFSALPYSSCFFCGKAGPESVMEVFMKDNEALRFVDHAVVLKGKLRLTNGSNQGLLYRLEDAIKIE